MEMTAKQRFERAMYQLSTHEHYKFFGAILMSGDIHIDTSVSTGATDGLNCYYNPEFILSLTEPELRFLLIHEAYHKMYKHVFVWANLRKLHGGMLVNMGCDYVINLQIVDMDKPYGFLSIPTWKEGEKAGEVMGLIDEQFRGMDTVQVIHFLIDENEASKQQGGSSDGSKSGEDGDSTESSSSQPSTGESASGEYSQATLDRLKEQLDEHKFDEKLSESSKEELNELNEQVDDIVRSASQLFGSELGDAVSRGIKEALATETPWEEVLKHFVTVHNKDAQMAHWKKYNKTLLGAGVYMPSYYGETSGDIRMDCDMSGSISTVAQQRAIGALLEVADITKPTGLHISYWDTKVRGTETYTPDEYDNIADMTKPMGGGGTDVDCVVHDINDKLNTGVYSEGLECAIIITDGWFHDDLDASWSALDIPVLWCIDNFEGYANVDFNPPCGTKLIMKEQ